MSQTGPLPVVLVTGLHARSRRHVVDELLLALPGSVAVRHDIRGSTGRNVRRVLRDRWGERERTPVGEAGSCFSCALLRDLVPLLLDIAERGEDRLCVVETHGAVEPQTVAEALTLARSEGRPIAERLRLAAVVGAVHTGSLLTDLATTDTLADRGLGTAGDRRTVAEALAHQLEYPTVLAPHGTSSGTAPYEQCAALLSQLNPAALVVEPDGAELAGLADGTFDPLAARARVDPVTAQPPTGLERARVRTVTWHRALPLHPGRLHAALDELVATTLRSRGRFWLASRPDTLLVWDAAGASLAVESAGPWAAALPGAAWELLGEHRKASAGLDWTPAAGDRCQCLSFTGLDLDADRLLRVLDGCLLTEEERADMSRFIPEDDPFAAVLDTAA
ncbi:G3E family GTPase [Haloactinospora alba]|uniref:G3E family GTPase n=1 Tax=Haloactinospora alba TaxID=405555 RepID=A0A543NP03_9ACTN|nr:GTP-binding protein [Haloactinospora alba]TQN33569.1 G3E family GTPase [Haloactinospora alba]